MRFILAVGVCGLMGLTGCSMSSINQGSTPDVAGGVRLSGSVLGGQQSIVGAHVYLFAAGTTGYGAASTSLLTAGTGRTLDSSGGPTNGDYYVTTDATGSFTITGDYTCVVGTQVYAYALGGNPGTGTNSAAGLMAALGSCPAAANFATTAPYILMNEVSTVAAAYGFAGFATDAVHVSSSGTAAAKAGLANAFINAAILETLGTGVANAFPPPGNGYYGGGGSVPQSAVNTLGNILAACVNSASSSSATCTSLFSNAMNGSTVPTDTATAAINIAHNPAANVTALYALASAYAQFAPALTVQPNDFTLTIFYSGSFTMTFAPGIGPVADAAGDIWWTNPSAVEEVNNQGYDLTTSSNTLGIPGYSVPTPPTAIALDINGDLWSVNTNSTASAGRLNELTPAGATGPGSPFTGLGITNPTGLALDGSSNSWITNTSPGEVIKATSAGVLSGPFTTGGIVSPQAVAIDGSGNAWIADTSAVIKLSSAGVAQSGTSGYTGIGLNAPKAIAIDHSGNVWVANSGGNNVIEISSTGTVLSGTGGYTASSLAGAFAIDIDGAGNAWVLGTTGGRYTTTELSNTGTVLSGPNGYIAGSSGGLAIDGSGDVWTNYTANNFPFGYSYYIAEMVGAAAPVVTPIALGVKNNTLGSRP